MRAAAWSPEPYLVGDRRGAEVQVQFCQLIFGTIDTQQAMI